MGATAPPIHRYEGMKCERGLICLSGLRVKPLEEVKIGFLSVGEAMSATNKDYYDELPDSYFGGHEDTT